MTREFAWKPRWATIRLVNSWARSTFDISSVEPWSVPRPPLPAVPIWARPELTVGRNSEPPTFSRPTGFEKPARAIWPMGRLRPVEDTPGATPARAVEKRWGEAGGGTSRG